MDNKNKQNEILYGYQPSFIEINFKKLIKVILSLLQINGNNKYSNWILESINPRILVQSKIDRSIKFKWITGNNRLLWRAKTFDTEETMMVKWISQFKEEDVFLDIGANCGLYTLAAACKCKNITAVELDTINLAVLKENLVINSFEERALVIPLAAANSNKKEVIYFRSCSKSDALQSISKPSELGTRLYEGNHKSYHLLFSLDFLYNEFKLDKPNKIKIDVDGNEKELFEGAKEIILNANEIYYEDSGFEDSKNVLNTILNSGFEVFKSEKPLKTLRGKNLLLKKIRK